MIDFTILSDHVMRTYLGFGKRERFQGLCHRILRGVVNYHIIRPAEIEIRSRHRIIGVIQEQGVGPIFGNGKLFQFLRKFRSALLIITVGRFVGIGATGENRS